MRLSTVRRRLSILLLGTSLVVTGQFFSAALTPVALADEDNIYPSVSLSASAAPSVSSQLLSATQLGQWLRRFRPPQEGQPRSTANGSSRDQHSCNANEPAMQAQLSPNKYGLTLERHPTIFVDTRGTSAQQALLIMRSQDRDGQMYYRQATLPVSDTEGLSEFRLPEEIPPLEIDKTYAWSLSFLCGDFSTPSDPTFTGWVRRTEKTPEAEEILNKTPFEAQAYWLSENGYWYDLIAAAMTTLDY